MLKKCLIFLFMFGVLEVKSDCEGLFECFFSNFFVSNTPDVEYVNVTSKNLPENFVELKDVEETDISKVLSELTSFIQQDIAERLKAASDMAFTNVNPDTKIFVKTYNFKIDNLEQKDKFNKENEKEINIEKQNEGPVNIENRSLTQIETIPKIKTEAKKSIQKDIRENLIPTDDDISYYDSVEDNSTDYPIIDYMELYKDTTNEENLYDPTEIPEDIKSHVQTSVDEYVLGLENIIWDINNNSDTNNSTDVTEVYPWIATIFVKNDTKGDQFEYYCDGALLNEKLLITAARCVNTANSTVEPDSLLVILGKRSLQSMGGKEQIVKVKNIITHDNFTNVNGTVEHDLALLTLEEAVEFNDLIQPAVVGNDTQDVDRLVTTAWDVQGELMPVFLDDKEDNICNSRDAGKHMFCASYGLDVALCPSYGGIFAAKQQEAWRLYGVRSGDAAYRGVCYDKHVWFTDLRGYGDWIMGHFE